MFCIECGDRLVSGARFCASCGCPAPEKRHTGEGYDRRQDDQGKRGDSARARVEEENFPACVVCHNLVANSGVEFLGQHWHSVCFCCTRCKVRPDTEQFEWMADHGDPFCPACITKMCKGCGLLLRDPVVSAMKHDWHVDCFRCRGCDAAIEGNFITDNGQPYCRVECLPLACAGCEKPLSAPVIEALGQQWHKLCFVCTTCTKPVHTGYIVADDGRPYCSDRCNPDRQRARAPVAVPATSPSGTRRRSADRCECGAPAPEGAFCAQCGVKRRSSKSHPRESEPALRDGQRLSPTRNITMSPVLLHDGEYRRASKRPSGSSHGTHVHEGPRSCTGCKLMIASVVLAHGPHAWHEQCFVCTACKRHLVSRDYVVKDSWPYCDGCVPASSYAGSVASFSDAGRGPSVSPAPRPRSKSRSKSPGKQAGTSSRTPSERPGDFGSRYSRSPSDASRGGSIAPSEVDDSRSIASSRMDARTAAAHVRNHTAKAGHCAGCDRNVAHLGNWAMGALWCARCLPAAGAPSEIGDD